MVILTEGETRELNVSLIEVAPSTVSETSIYGTVLYVYGSLAWQRLTVVNATVSLDGQTTNTDYAGRFEFKDIAPGTYIIRAEHYLRGISEVTTTVELGERKKVQILMFA